MSGRLIEEDLFTKYSIINNCIPEGQKIHYFLAARARVLAGKYIDFDKTPLTFVFSDVDEPNAFFAPAPDPNPEKKPQRNDYETIRFVKNPLNTPVICVTRGLFEMVDNLDQLDFVIAHELTHLIMRQHGIKYNSKGEEEIADIHAIDLIYDTGGDPKQALLMSEKISNYLKKERKKYKANREKKRGINWSEIFDVHMTDGNRKSGIEASLTRLSHLIDDKQPTPIDKSFFDVRYSDPIDVFLRANDYDRKKPFGKLRILIDCIDHLSTFIPAEKFFQDELNALPIETDRFDWLLTNRRRSLQERIDAGYRDYFNGPVIDKKYQQKIANLAECAIQLAEDKEQDEENAVRLIIFDSENLNIYLQNKAYQHIAANSYPEPSDLNRESASGILYSYFYCLLESNSSKNRREEDGVRKKPRIDIDIEIAKKKLKNANTTENFTQAVETLNKLNKIRRDIRTTKYGYEGRGDKLDNLSSLSDYQFNYYRDNDNAYDTLKGNQSISWNNLIEIAKTDEQAKKRVIQFLKQNQIEDFRITHGLPYIRAGYSNSYEVTENGKSSAKKVPDYVIDFSVNRDIILQAYDYVKNYFNNETLVIDEKCAKALSIENVDFNSYKTTAEISNINSVAQKKIYDFVSVFNALPDKKEDDKFRQDSSIISLIPQSYRKDYPIPGSKMIEASWQKEITFEFNENLFNFENPIFKNYFGKEFEQQLISKKETQQQKMYDTAFALLNKSIDMWLEVKPYLNDLVERRTDLYSQISELENQELIETKNIERTTLENEISLYKEKENDTSGFIFNSLNSIFSGQRYWYQLQKLKSEQKIALAKFAIQDEKGAIMQLFHAEGYERFCDYLGILEDQTERAISGNYELTEPMKVISNHYSYHPSKTIEELKGFVDKHRNSKYNGDNQKYAWYLHIFDTIEYLQKTPVIDVCCLAIALMKIEEEDKSYNGYDDYDIVTKRYQNYKKFMLQNTVIDSIACAVDYKDNYKDLSYDKLLQTADALIAVRNQMTKIYEGKSDHNYFGEKQKSQIEPKQENFLNLIDKNIRGLLRKAEHYCLQNKNSLEKFTNLYLLYNPAGDKYSDKHRGHYLDKMQRQENHLKHISTLSKEQSFWPSDVLEHVKSFVFAKNTFLDDKELEDLLLKDILEKLEVEHTGKKKNDCLFILLDKNLRAAYPKTRDRLFAIFTNDILAKMGKDNGAEIYQKRLNIYLNALTNETKKDWDIGNKNGQKNSLLSNSMSSADEYLLMRCLSDEIISQEQTSQMIKESCQIKLSSDDMLESYLYGIGVDYLTEEMDSDSEVANKFIDFFNSKGEQKDCSDINAYIEVKMKVKYSQDKNQLDLILKNATSSNCKILYENFWSAPLEARSLIIARMLKSAVNTCENEENESKQSWNQVFDLVMDNVITPLDNSSEAKYARNIMHSYIKSRSDYERVLIMSAMMVANRNIGNDKGNIGKALKLFLENMGPAEIKVGQAISSHPSTPVGIKAELQKLKSTAGIPARWTLYEWIRAENIPEKSWKNRYLGKILGSASYYTTVALGDDEVLRILRPEAREKATKGFRVIGSTIDDLKHKEATSDLDYREFTSSVDEMVTQAAKMSKIETNHDIGQKQYEDAKKIYNGVTIASGGMAFSLKVMDWKARGKNWIIMDRARGHNFNAITEETTEQINYKKHFAKAYIVFEITNILSGKKFDHDKHGDQLSIDPETNIIGIYDTGAMAIDDPSIDDQKMLGNIIYDITKAALNGDEIFKSFTSIIDEKIEERHQIGTDIQYLVEVKKGLLALGDFFKLLTIKDIKDILPSINLAQDISKNVRYGITEKMSTFEKVQYQASLAVRSSNRKDGVIVERANIASDFDTNTDSITASPTIRSKADWFQDTFPKLNSHEEDSNFSPLTPMVYRAKHESLLLKLA